MKNNKIKVLCGGCFNHLHRGHIYFLKKAKSFGDYLIVVVSNDRLNRKKYGRRAVSSEKRKTGIEKLKITNKVIVGNDPVNYKKVIEKFGPDIIALGYDQDIELGRTGLKIIRIPKLSLSGRKR